ncbi:replication protein A 70 kDa DNA-binding subunit B-like [Apium graveolens]|uniref:replication protein A 70 kDa DNA-binding subunit B-like n=1 Tax=Apium graveolens TaxID=4045 RepID=UPI003D7B55D2
MHAAIRKHLVSRFKHRVSEGLVYSLKNVRIAVNALQYRPLASNQKLLFLPTTEIVQLDEGVISIPRFGFQFVDLPKLQERADDVTTLSDIVGCFCGYGEVEVVGAGYKKRDIKIFTDYSVTSTVTLWGKLGETFDPTLYIGESAPYVIVVSSVTVKTFQRALTFATTSASKIYANPDVEHVSSIRERFSALTPRVVAIEGSASAKLPPEEAMFVNRMTVESLVRATCDGELKVGVVTLKANITAINNRFGWYYISCKSCVKRCTLREGIFVCNSCKKPVTLPLAMFCVNLQVEDRTGTTTVVLLNSTAERLLDTSANKLINKMPAGDTSVPPELEALVGREFVYKLKLNKYNLVEGLQDYGVSTIFVPVDELEIAYEKNAKAQATPDVVGSSAGSVPGGGNDRKRKLSPVAEAVEAAPGGNNGAS